MLGEEGALSMKRAGRGGCRVSGCQARALHPCCAPWSPVRPKFMRQTVLLFPLPPALSVSGAFEHPGCRKEEGISERMHWVRKNKRGWEGYVCSTEAGNKENETPV